MTFLLYTRNSTLKLTKDPILAKNFLFPTGSMRWSPNDRTPSEPPRLPQSTQTHSINHGRIMHSGCTCDREWLSAEHRACFACRLVRLYFSPGPVWEFPGLGGGEGGILIVFWNRNNDAFWLSRHNTKEKLGSKMSQCTQVCKAARAARNTILLSCNLV